jgi:hypothetical protein
MFMSQKNSYEINYFPDTKTLCQSIKSKYLYEESIRKIKELIRQDHNAQTVLEGNTWYKIYVRETNNKEYSKVFDYIRSLDFINLTGEKLSMDITMIVKYHNHNPVIIYNYDYDINEIMIGQLIKNEQLLVDELTELTSLD